MRKGQNEAQEKMNTLYYGDNLKILRKYIPDESVNLIYLDPPFNSKKAYNVIFKDKAAEIIVIYPRRSL